MKRSLSLHVQVDDASDTEVPKCPIDVSGLLEKYRLHVNGQFCLRSETQTTILMEYGSASKDTSAVINELLINIISRSHHERPEVIVIANDCGACLLACASLRFAAPEVCSRSLAHATADVHISRSDAVEPVHGATGCIPRRQEVLQVLRLVLS